MITEIPISFKNRTKGKPKLGFNSLIKGCQMILESKLKYFMEKI